MGDDGFGKVAAVMPGRRIIVSALVAAVGTGSLAGLVLGVVAPYRPPASAANSTQNQAEQVNALAGGQSAGGPTAPVAAPTTQARPKLSTTPTVTTVTGTPDTAPTQFIEQPWTQPSMELALLTDVQRDNGTVVIKVRRATLLTGDAAKKFYNQKGQDRQDFAVLDQGGRQVRYLLRDDAAIFGQYALGDHTNVQTRPLSLDEFVGAAQNALSNGDHPAVWLRHSNRIANAPVIYLAEQYLP